MCFNLLSCSGKPRAVGAGRDLTFTTSDGVTIGATLYPAAGTNPAGLVLVPMLGTTRDRWDRFAQTAQSQGYTSIAIDMRGHGESTSRQGQSISYKSFSTAEWLEAVHDIEAAKKALIDEGVDPDNIAVIGASIGANLALKFAVADPGTQAVVLLSPGKDYKGVGTEEAMRNFGNRPVLLMTSTGDAYSAETCAALKKIATGHCELREYDGAAHGTDLLDAHSTCADQILLWLSAIIGPEAASANRSASAP